MAQQWGMNDQVVTPVGAPGPDPMADYDLIPVTRADPRRGAELVQTYAQTGQTEAQTERIQTETEQTRQQMQMGNIPPGWRLKEDGSGIEPIAGWKEDPNAPAAIRMDAKDRSALTKQESKLRFAQGRIAELQKLYKDDLKGFRLREIPESIGLQGIIPDAWRGKAQRFDAVGGTFMGELKEAMGMTGGEANNAVEITLRFGPYIPKASDSDETIEYKIKMLNDLLENEITGVSKRLGTEGDIGFNTPDQDPRGNPLTPEQQAAYDAFLKARPDATAADLDAFAKSMDLGGMPNAQEVLDAYKETGQFVPGSEAQMAPVDISDVRGEGGALETLDAGVRAAANTVTAGAADRIQAAGSTLFGGGTYDENLARQFEITNYDWQNHAIASTVGTVAGALAIPTGVRNAASVAAKQVMRSGGTREAAVTAARNAAALRLGKEGGAYGVVQGGMTSQGDLADRAAQAAVSGLVGAATGAVLPFAGAGAAKGARAVKSVFEGAPELANRVVYTAIKADGNTPRDVGRMAGAANENGVPFMVADSGENARGLMSASARAPGPGRTKAIGALDERQGALGDRVVKHIERDLGPIANPHKIADDLMSEAASNAGPLYASAYAKPGADAFGTKIAPLLGRPSMQRALANAQRLVTEEGGDPTALGFDFNEAGDVILKRVPSWQTLDYVKRGMDDVVEGYRDKTTGKLVLDTEGRAINNTLRQFLGAFDKANPDYAAARSAYGGPVRGIEAMNQGRKALSMTADDLEARMRDMTPFDREMFALGTRRAMAELVESKGDSANIVHALAGTGKKRAMMARLFGGRKEFTRFVNTLGTEEEAFQTFKRARTGSPTAPNAKDDTELAVATGISDLATTGVPVVTALRMAARAKSASARKDAEDVIAAMLGETDPDQVQALIRRFRQEETKLAKAKKRNPAASTVSKSAAALTPSTE